MPSDHQQDPSSMDGQDPSSLQDPQETLQKDTSLNPVVQQEHKAGLARRNLLKGAAIAGGVLAAIGGGGTLAVQHTLASSGTSANAASLVQQSGGGQLREYWVQANSFFHNLVPNGKDGMMGMTFKPQESSFWAVGYVAYTPGWGKPLAGNHDIGENTGIPGPVFRGSVGDTIRVHFRNNDTHYRAPHSMHPHGVIYTPANDGAYIVSDPRPGTAVALGETYTYEWQVRPNSVGTWVYHDHSVSATIAGSMIMEYWNQLGMFGFLVLTDASIKPVTHEFFTFLHDLYQSDVPSLAQDFDGFNGHSYLGNTPTFNAKVGDTIRWHIGALGREFHAFHLHGHRWISNGQFVDVVTLGPAIATSFEFVADNPGKWLYHCHFTDHMGGGMIGQYIINS
jgi:manganese oxidase